MQTDVIYSSLWLCSNCPFLLPIILSSHSLTSRLSMLSSLFRNKPLIFILLNALIFQIGWLVCILFGSRWALLFTSAALLFHFYASPIRLADAIAVVLAVLIGLIHDSILLYWEHISFAETRYIGPVWIICLWGLLGTNLNHSLRWIYQRPWIAATSGAFCGPITYVAGVRLSTAEWSSPLIEVLPLISVLWFFVLPLHRFLSLRILAYVETRKLRFNG
jgi:hypothetical protein